jgi:amino acid adenylation domain-containing protein
MMELPERMAVLSPERRALLEARLTSQGLGRLEPTSVPRRTHGSLAPLSFAQQRLWFLNQLEPGSSAYHMPWAARLTGPLDVAALQRAFDTIVARHEALRTTFVAVDGSPLQVVAPTLAVPLSLVDLTDLPASEREGAARSLAHEEVRHPFELTRGPLLRTTLVRLGPVEHVLLLTVHHIVSDGWSMGVLFRELATLYGAFTRGEPSPLPELPIQYADYAVWQREWLRGPVLEQELDYWRRQLQDAPGAIDLPTDHPRPPVQDLRGGKESLVLPQPLSEGLKALSRQEGATLFMTLLAGFNALLTLHSGQDDLVVGAPVAGRTRVETEGLIGFFINSLALRTRLGGNPTFRELLGRVREVALGAYTHQEFPFEKLVEELQPERDLSRSPIFQLFFNMENAPTGRLALPGLRVERVSRGTDGAKFDLAMYAKEGPGGIGCTLAYSVGLFEPSTAASLLERYRTLLEGAVVDPDRRLSTLPLLSDTERLRRSVPGSRVEPSNGFVEFPPEGIEHSIPERFDEQVRARAQQLAVKTAVHTWTYGRLHRATVRVSEALLADGHPEGNRVALLLGHGAPMVAAVLGVLRAGHAYVPLDGSHPEARLSQQLADAEVAALLTDSANLALARALAGETLRLVNLDELVSDSVTDVDDRGWGGPRTPIPPDALAYLLYTSGTTGRPKGVMQNHRNVLHWIRTYTNALHLGPGDRLTLLSSYGFDASVMDLFGALLNGATLCPLDLRADVPAALCAQIRAERITVLHSTPTVFRHLVSALAADEQLAPTIRIVVLGGEEATRQDVELFKAHFAPDCLLVNGLGPTESTMALQYFVGQRTELERHALPVGYPVDGTEITLLDAAANKVEVYGEIAIRSPHVSLGYWRQPELTAATFQTDPENGGQRLYRTGDLGRLLPDGAIEYRGRKDRQFKLRGHRVEPSEIESALGEHPAVRECAVVLYNHQSWEPALVAYLVPASGTPSTPDALRAHLRARLPEYMLPQAWIFLHQLPLLSNGKLDRRRLPIPDDLPRAAQNGYVAPRTPAEEQLCAIWREVLRISEVGVRTNFFELGGHSLSATRVISRVRAALGVDLPLRTIFEQPTVEGLALAAVTMRAQASGADLTQLLAELEELAPEQTESPPALVRLPREAFRASRPSTASDSAEA